VPRQCLATICALVTALGALSGCGGDASDDDRATAADRPAAAAPALATRPAGPGEFVVRGEASPETKGPYEFDGRYLVRFEQYAPEDPALDFAGQTPFEASLTPREGDPRGATRLFSSARASGRRELEIRGRRFVEVSFGDFPYVVRFTPRGG
jgi:hypothetical protein